MERWYPVVCACIPRLDWVVYREHFLPLFIKMADLSHPPVSRHAATMILATTANIAANHNLLTQPLVQACLDLCQDTDTNIRKAMISNFNTLLPVVKDAQVVASLLAEVQRASHEVAYARTTRSRELLAHAGH